MPKAHHLQVSANQHTEIFSNYLYDIKEIKIQQFIRFPFFNLFLNFSSPFYDRRKDEETLYEGFTFLIVNFLADGIIP